MKKDGRMEENQSKKKKGAQLVGVTDGHWDDAGNRWYVSHYLFAREIR